MSPDAPIFRDLTPADVAAGLALSRAIGWNQTQADWRSLLQPPAVFRGAVVNGRVVGTAGAVCYGREIAWVCMVLVDPAFRGRGLASRLVAEVLERLRGFALVGLDATPQGRPVYARLGFADGYGLARMATEAATEPATAAADARVRGLREEDLQVVLPWDLQVFGADRSRLLRQLRAAAAQYALVLEERGRLGGYCFGRHGTNADHLGPLVAETVEGARALVRAVRSRNPEQRFFMDVTTDPSWRAAVEALGFREQRPFTRMYRGGHAPAKAPAGLRAVLGPEFG